MSEIQLRPIPSHLDYKAGFERADAIFQSNGGARSHIMEVEYDASHGSSKIEFDNVLYTGTLALRLEPKNERGVVRDNTMRITHAFKRGMLATFYATYFVNDGRILPIHIRQAIDKGFQHEEIDEDTPFADEPPILEWGHQGIEFMGTAAAAIVDKWGSSFYSDERTQRLFRLGSGAVIATAHALAVQENMVYIDENIGDYNWTEELENLGRSNTGE